MKTLAFQRNYFTAELWTYTITGGGDTKDFKFGRFVNFTMGTDNMLSRVTVYADEQFPKDCWLVNIKDRSGKDVYLVDPQDVEEGLVPIRGLVINTVEPVISFFGYREGFRHRCGGLNTEA